MRALPRHWMIVAAGFELIALGALLVAVLPLHDPEAPGWTAFLVDDRPVRGLSRVTSVPLFDPALWFGAAVGFGVAGLVVLLVAVTEPDRRRRASARR